MKYLIVLILLINCLPSPGQQLDLIRIALEDTSNFNLTKALGNQKPQHIFLWKETELWNPTRFKIEDVDLNSVAIIDSIKLDEHHPYNWSYLFKDSVLNRLIPENAKNQLFKKASEIKPRTLNLSGSNFTVIKSLAKVKKGFFFSVSEPLLTEDNNFAFVDFTIFKTEYKTRKIKDCYLGTTCLIYKRTNSGWKKITEKNYLIL